MYNFLDRGDDTPVLSQAGKNTHGYCQNDPSPWSEGDILGTFSLEKLLGSGSSGFVYRALDHKTDRHCAIKILRTGDTDAIVRNRLGFRRMMQIEHPNLLRVDRIYQVGEHTLLAMEEVKGITFSQVVKRLKELPPEEGFRRLLELTRDFAAGLAAMHSAELIHRDVKPQNLMVEEDGRGRVIDFGLVDVSEPERNGAEVGNFILGTPHYLAPEVIYRQQYLPAGDIFGLGIVILEALQVLAGETKHSNRNEMDTPSQRPNLERSEASRIDAEMISGALADLSSDVPELIHDACRQMLSRYPDERPMATWVSRLGLPKRAPVLISADDSMIGRQSQLDEMNGWVDSVFAGAVSRLRVTGPSGIGKTRLLDELIASIESRNWCQVFRGRCRLREDSALQAFEQICDAIANRYMKGDRERVRLDPVSAEILCTVFPVLQNTIKSCLDLPSASTETARLDSLEAAVRFSHQLREIGPLFIVIDDAQWADRDSLNVLDRLQSSGGGIGLGIITVSRDTPDAQRVPADHTIELGPIKQPYLIDYLGRAAERWAIPISDSALADLGRATGGSPFRLRELANEFRPGGAFSQLDLDTDPECSFTRLVSIGHLWRCRVERLSDEAKSALLYVVTAGGFVSTKQLGELTGLGDDIDAAVSELSQLRLITDEATGGECIAIYHDKFAEHMIKTLSESEKRDANQAWASLLVRQENPESLAARIAGHWFAAGQPGRAISHAIMAAEDAERRVAKTEAARWHARVIDYVSGDEQTHHIRQAARRYHEADIPVKAAKYYQMLAVRVDPEERFRCSLLASVMLLRSGRFGLVRDEVARLSAALGLPRPKKPLLAKLGIAVGLLRLRLHRRSLIDTLVAQAARMESKLSTLPALGEDPEMAQSISNTSRSRLVASERRHRQQFETCLALVRPMSMFDNLYAAELNIAAARIARVHGTLDQRIHVAVGEAVFGSYEKGTRRVESLSNLLKLLPIADRHGGFGAKGDVRAGLAFSHMLAARWEQVDHPLNSAIENYCQVEDSYGFEIAHVRWTGLWASWNLGRWDKMIETSDQMFDDATRLNNLFQQRVTHGGLGGNAWLIRDRADRLRQLQDKHADMDQLRPSEVLNIFDRFSRTYRSLYGGDLTSAWKLYEELEGQTAHLPFVQIQCFRLQRQSIGALLALHLYCREPNELWSHRIRSLIAELRSERVRYASVLADHYEGLLHWQISLHAASASDARRANEIASQRLAQAQFRATEAHLRPIQLASADILSHISTGRSLGLLRERMISRGVVKPDQLASLYTIQP